MSVNKKQGNAQIPREAIKGAAGLGAEENFDIGMMALQEENEKGKIVPTHMGKCEGPIQAMKTPDFSSVKAYDGGFEEVSNKRRQEKTERDE